MKDAAAITEMPRTIMIDSISSFPLISIAWRVLQAQQKNIHQEKKLTEKKFTELTEGVVRYKSLLKKFGENEDFKANYGKYLDASDQQITIALENLGISIMAPEQELFTSEYMDIFENIAQIPSASVEQPVIKEVVEPAVLYQGNLIKMGKAIISVPIQAKETEDGS